MILIVKIMYIIWINRNIRLEVIGLLKERLEKHNTFKGVKGWRILVISSQ
jgi:hypothetical protein